MESRDRLEKFVIENKADFGPKDGLPDVWSNVQKRDVQESAGKSRVQFWLARAASVVIIFSLAYSFFVFTNKNDASITKENIADQAMTELMEADDYYSSIISQRKSELFQLTESSSSIRDDVDRDFADLDAILLELRNDLQDNAANAEVIEAMMQHYRLKLEILEDMLEQVKMNKSNNQNEEGISI